MTFVSVLTVNVEAFVSQFYLLCIYILKSLVIQQFLHQLIPQNILTEQ